MVLTALVSALPAVDSLSTVDTHGGYIGYRVRQFAMRALMNGTHAGLIPLCGTFVVFSDDARTAVRLSGLRAMPNLCAFRPAKALAGRGA